MSIPPSELNQIIRAAQRGEEAAVVSLYQAYSQVIYRYIAYRVPVEEAEDLTAEVFVKVVKALPNYRISEAPFEACCIALPVRALPITIAAIHDAQPLSYRSPHQSLIRYLKSKC